MPTPGFARLAPGGAPLDHLNGFPSVSGTVLAIYGSMIGGANLTSDGAAVHSVLRITGTNVAKDEAAIGLGMLNPELGPAFSIGEGVVMTKSPESPEIFVRSGSGFAQQWYVHGDGTVQAVAFQGSDIIAAGNFTTIKIGLGLTGMHYGIARISEEPRRSSNFMGLPRIYGDFLILHPEFSYGAQVQVSPDLLTWTNNPSGIRDTVLTAPARFYRMTPAAK